MAASREEVALGARYGSSYTALALDAVREPVLIIESLHARFNIILANAASRRLFRHQHAPIVGASALEFLEYASRQPFIDAVGRLKSGGSVESQQITWLGPDFNGDCATEFKLLADPDLGEALMLTLPSVTVADITGRMRLEREVLEISAREQERIGQDLHDGLGQELTGVALMLRSLSTKIRRDHPNANVDVEDIIALVNRSIETARSLARGLSPLDTERGGLVHALRALAARSRELYGLNVRFHSKVWPQLTLDEARCGHLYRIAQEALTNIARHAQATRADIRLLVADNEFTLTISDDGVGLGACAKSTDGMGLKLMAYRAGMIGAKLDIAPNEPKGTLVRISGEQPPLM